MDLIRSAPLQRAYIAAGIIETGGELYNFYMPIYGHSIGLSASVIGMILGTYAVAVLLTRLVMSALVKRSSEEGVLCGSLALAAVACVVFPFVTSVYMLAGISFVLGLGLGCCGPLSMVITYNRAPEGRSGPGRFARAVGGRKAPGRVRCGRRRVHLTILMGWPAVGSLSG
jgi:MFS family permease